MARRTSCRGSSSAAGSSGRQARELAALLFSPAIRLGHPEALAQLDLGPATLSRDCHRTTVVVLRVGGIAATPHPRPGKVAAPRWLT